MFEPLVICVRQQSSNLTLKLNIVQGRRGVDHTPITQIGGPSHAQHACTPHTKGGRNERSRFGRR